MVYVQLVRQRVLSECGTPCNVVSEYDLSETIKVTMLTLPYQHVNPIHVEMRPGGRANDQFDFLLFVARCISERLLLRGDVLVIDNASIHKAQHVLLPLQRLLQTAGVMLWMLPTYSPELNPCEYVFAQCKKYLRYHRRMHYPFWYEIVVGFSKTTHTHMLHCYIKSIWDP